MVCYAVGVGMWSKVTIEDMAEGDASPRSSLAFFAVSVLCPESIRFFPE